MGKALRFLPYAANLNTSGGTSAWINQIKSESPDSGIKLFEEASGSEIDRMFVADQSIEPTVKLDTTDLALGTTVGNSHVQINAGSGTPGFTLYGRYFPTGSVPDPIANSTHMTLVVSDGILVPVSISASHNSIATFSLLVHATLGTGGSSGATPFVYTLNQAIPSGSTATVNQYTVGAVKYDSTLLTGIEDIRVNFGIKVAKEGSDGEVYPSFAGVMMRMNTIEFTTADPQLMATIGDAYALSSSFAVYFRKILFGGTRVPAATATHIKVSGTTGMIKPGGVSLAHQKPGTATFTYSPTGTTQLAIALAAIPTS
jgi:hypothetical protein